MKKSVLLLAALFATVAVSANEPDKKAWEIGLGGSVFQFNRVNFVGFDTSEDGHHVNMQLRHVAWGGNIYVARELSNVFALDFQGTLGGADKKWLAQAGLGVQWRLGHYFHSRYIDPYLRVGANYLYKGFDILYGSSLNGMNWEMINDLNKYGADSHRLFNVAAGVGVNMWLNDRLGIGMQGDYLIIPKPDVANSLQGTVRLMWRIGGKSKKTAGYSDTPALPVEKVIEYRDVVVRDTVFVDREKVVEVDRGNVYGLMQGIHFDFDSSELKPEFGDAIVKIAELLNEDTSRRYLITGYADARGSAPYDETLSLNRAKTVADALAAHGVPVEMLKIAGGGKRISHAAYGADDRTREGDRKVTIELITNMDYWNAL